MGLIAEIWSQLIAPLLVAGLMTAAVGLLLALAWIGVRVLCAVLDRITETHRQ